MVDALDAHLGLPPSGLAGMLAPTGTHPGGEHHAARGDARATADDDPAAGSGATPAATGTDRHRAPPSRDAAPGAAKEA